MTGARAGAASSKPATRSAVVSRTLAATVGGYAVASLCAVLLALVLPTSRAEAVQTGMLVSAPIWIAVWIWVFSVRSAWRAWLGVGFGSLLLAGMSWLVWLVWLGDRA